MHFPRQRDAMDCGPEAQACFWVVCVPHEYPPRSIGWYPVSVYSGERRVQIVPRRLRTILVRAGRKSLYVPMPGRDTDLRRKETQTGTVTRYRPRRSRDTDLRRKETQTGTVTRYRPTPKGDTDRNGHEIQTEEIFLTRARFTALSVPSDSSVSSLPDVFTRKR